MAMETALATVGEVQFGNHKPNRSRNNSRPSAATDRIMAIDPAAGISVMGQIMATGPVAETSATDRTTAIGPAAGVATLPINRSNCLPTATTDCRAMGPSKDHQPCRPNPRPTPDREASKGPRPSLPNTRPGLLRHKPPTSRVKEPNSVPLATNPHLHLAPLPPATPVAAAAEGSSAKRGFFVFTNL